mmetsp:Transcript_16832/g.28885  ORF Transcript_16832/g.28885 Transcript_16832/m.28885 type:complete len:438 (-) Transcript_16832:744-2057(-)
MLKARYDAVIVGAGVIGTSIALELSRLGYSTLNIDRNKSAGYGTTSFSSGIVRTTYSTLEATKFSWECFHMWKQWDDIVQPTQGEDSLIFRQHPGVFLMNGISKGFLEKCMENSRVLGIPFEKVSTKELEDRFDLETIQFGEPRKIDDPLFGEGCGKCEYGVIFPMMGYINDPQYATTTLKRATERSGGDFLFSKTVTGVNVSPDKTISGVELNDGSTVQAPIVINAAGPHSSFINRMAFERNNIKSDATVGTRPLRVEVAYLPIVGSSREIPFSGDPEVGVYWRPDPGGKKMVVGSIEPACDELHFLDDPDQALDTGEFGQLTEESETLAYRAALRVNSIGIPNTASGIVSAYDVSDDWMPIYDKTNLPGYFVAIGTSGNQFKNAPLVGKLMSTIITNADNDGPVQLSLPITSQILDAGVYSRKRRNNETSGSVMS